MSSRGTNIHFLKKIEEDSLRNGELRIPRSFVNKFWEGMSNPVHLILPNGDKRYVKWKKLDADVWLIEDWKEFAEAYCLDHNHLLVFKYVGKSEFEVVIFDQSGLEMEYPLMEGTLDGEENVGIILRRSKRAKSPSCSNTKKVKTNPRKKPCSYPNQDVETKRGQSRTRKTNRGGRKVMHANKFKGIKSEGLSAVERAQTFCSQSHNSTFLCEMKPSYIKSGVLAMPSSFAKEVKEWKVGDSVSLGIFLDHKTWSVKVRLNRHNGQLSLSRGWKVFAKENNLKLGDVCVFEKIKSQGFSFRIRIFRHGEKSTSPTIPDSESPRPNKEVLVAEPNPLHEERIPLKLMRNGGNENVTLQIGERSWPVRLV